MREFKTDRRANMQVMKANLTMSGIGAHKRVLTEVLTRSTGARN
jgi:hypothetical protein